MIIATLTTCLAGNKYKAKKKKVVVEEAAAAQPSRHAKPKASAEDADDTINTIPWEGYKPATEINVCSFFQLNQCLELAVANKHQQKRVEYLYVLKTKMRQVRHILVDKWSDSIRILDEIKRGW